MAIDIESPRQLVTSVLSGALQPYSFTTTYYTAITALIEGIFERRSPSLPPLDTLPQLTCLANNGTLAHAIPISATWAIVRLAAKLFDDLEDGDVTATPHRLNEASGIMALLPLLLQPLLERGVSNAKFHAISEALFTAILEAGAGQHHDFDAIAATGITVTPTDWLAIARAKSGTLLRWAAWAGAFVSDASPLANIYGEYGESLGVLVQIADDYYDTWGKRHRDLTTGTVSLPLCYTAYVLRDTHQGIDALWQQAKQGDSSAAATLLHYINESGAFLFMQETATLVWEQLNQALDRTNGHPDMVAQLRAIASPFYTPFAKTV